MLIGLHQETQRSKMATRKRLSSSVASSASQTSLGNNVLAYGYPTCPLKSTGSIYETVVYLVHAGVRFGLRSLPLCWANRCASVFYRNQHGYAYCQSRAALSLKVHITNTSDHD